MSLSTLKQSALPDINHAALLLGTNLGDRGANLASAKNLIAKLAGEIIKESSVYETAPWGIADQDNFLNQALLVSTNLSPPDLLKAILDIEKKMGRERIEKWGPRLIDIDILYYNEDIVYKDDLKIPHPYMQDRKFALVALNELSPDWIHPLLRKTAAQMLEGCKDTGWVRVLKISQNAE